MAKAKQVQFRRSDDITAQLNISDRYFRYMRSAGKFPEPDVRIGRLLLWADETVERWIAAQMKSGGSWSGRKGQASKGKAIASATQ
jgi:hypothetical protein